MISLRKFICIVLFLALAGCVADGPSNPVATSTATSAPLQKGPQIVPREIADWTALNSLSGISIDHLSTNSTRGGGSSVDESGVLFKVFPQEKFLTMTIAIPCNENGEDIEAAMVGSPGSDVSDQVNCSGTGWYLFDGLDRFQRTLKYQTATRFAANTLTFEGKSSELRSFYDNNNRFVGAFEETDEVRGAIQITGPTCRVLSWHQAETAGYRNGDKWNDTTESTPSTTCSLIRSSR